MSISPSCAARPVIDSSTRSIALRWATLAEKRLDYLTELFDTGRWRRFHNEADFLDNVHEAKSAVERWQAMARGEFVAPVIRVAKAAVTVALQAEPVAVAFAEPEPHEAEPREAEVLYFEDHATRARAQTASAVNPAADCEPPLEVIEPLDLFDHEAMVARYPMLRAAM